MDHEVTPRQALATYLNRGSPTPIIVYGETLPAKALMVRVLRGSEGTASEEFLSEAQRDGVLRQVDYEGDPPAVMTYRDAATILFLLLDDQREKAIREIANLGFGDTFEPVRPGEPYPTA
ncbi:MAG: hypothetical protein JWP76_5059 [Dactylosporangium sp.]|jgi:hypothetical protein|nr:hypothetical protein [Dactylosporangium sp.]